MEKYALIIIFILSTFSSVTAQELKPYHIHNGKYEHFLNRDLINTNFKKILKKPEKYQGKHINVRGFLVINKSKALLFENENEYQNHLNGLKVQKYKLLLTNEEAVFLQESCSNKKASIDGTFSVNLKEEPDGYNGTFSNICIVPILY